MSIVDGVLSIDTDGILYSKINGESVCIGRINMDDEDKDWVLRLPDLFNLYKLMDKYLSNIECEFVNTEIRKDIYRVITNIKKVETL